MLEDEMIKRDNLLTKCESFNKDLTDSLMILRKENRELKSKLDTEINRKKQWRKATIFESIVMATLFFLSTTIK
jgi:hypothetical protein